MTTKEKFPFQTSYAFFNISKGQNGGVDVFHDGKHVINLPRVNIWDKDEINRQLSQQKSTVINILSRIVDCESVDVLTKRNKELVIENKELKQKVENPVVNVCKANVEAIFTQCLNLMAETYNEKGFTMSRGNSILNKYKEHKEF